MANTQRDIVTVLLGFVTVLLGFAHVNVLLPMTPIQARGSSVEHGWP